MARAGHHYRGIPITPTADGRWQATVTVGRRRDGRRDRRHREGRTVAEVKAKLRSLLAEVDAGRKPATGRVPTVAEWLTTYLETIAPHGRHRTGPSQLRTQRALLEHWIAPAMGTLPLDQVEPEDLEQLYDTMRRAGRAESYVLKAHYLMRKSLRVAMRRGRLARNVAELLDPPGAGAPDRRPLAQDVTRRVLELTRDRPDAARWWLGLSVGPRQGEALGLTWDVLDLDAGTWRVEWQLQRRTWSHGCTDPVACAQPHCRTGPCPPRWDHGCQQPDRCRIQAWRCPARVPRPGACPTHRRGCPPACPPGCTRHARACPDRAGGGLVLERPKTWRHDRPTPVVAVPPPVVEMLREQRARQAEQRLHAGTAWRRIRRPDGESAQLVFTQVDGGPVDPRRDWQEWQDILVAAGAPRARVHAMRHTAATTLLELGVDIAVVQEVLRHTDIRMTRAYTHVAETLTRSAADRMGEWLDGGQVAAIDQARRRRAAGH